MDEQTPVVIADIKPGDVFLFHYHPSKEHGWDSRTHCFEGMLVVKEERTGIVLCDTYWQNDGTNGRQFTPDRAMAEGVLRHYFNLNDVDSITEWKREYYDDHEIFCLHNQHSCSPSCRNYYVRKGAAKSKEKMMHVVAEKIEEANCKARSAARDIERYTEIKAKIESGDLEVYF